MNYFLRTYLQQINNDSLFIYNFCLDAYDTKTNTSKGAFTYIIYDSDKNQTNYTYIGGKINKTNGIDSSMTITPLNDSVIQIFYPKGDKCNETANYRLKANLFCDCGGNATYFNETILLDQINKGNCDLTIDIKTYKKCIIKNYYVGYQFFLQFSYVLGPLMIIIGLLFIILGANKEALSGICGTGLAVAVFLFSFIFSFFLTIKVQDVKPTNLNVFIVILSGLLGGFIIGFFIRKLKKIISLSILNAGFGYLIGVFLFNLCLRYLTDNVDTIFWITSIIFAIAGALLPFYFLQYKRLTIISTAFIGGYLISRGIAVLFREKSGFPSENIIFDLLTRGEFNVVDKYRSPKVYIFLGIWIVISVVSFFVQTTLNAEKMDNDYAPIEQ